MLKDAHFMSIADRSILSCWGVNGGRAGMPFQVTIDPGGPREREVDALADAEPVAAGEVIRIRTTGGGGWGDPLDREPDVVVRDVVWRKVSAEEALAAYGVVLTGSSILAAGCGIGNEISGSMCVKVTRSTAFSIVTCSRTNFDKMVLGLMPACTTASRSGTSTVPGPPAGPVMTRPSMPTFMVMTPAATRHSRAVRMIVA